MTVEEEKELHARIAQARANWEARQKQRQSEEKPQSDTTLSQPTEQAKNVICKKKKLQLRKYLIGGAGKQNDNMLATVTSFVPIESGKIIRVGCLSWIVVGEMPLHPSERVEVTV